MQYLSAVKTIIASQQHYTVLPNIEPTDPEAWKAELAGQLPPLHDRSQFDQQISDYLTGDNKPNLSFLVSQCMKNGNVPVLTYILANENIRSLCIRGPINAQGWKTLAKAMPGRLPVEELTLSGVFLSASRGKLLFDDVLSHMPELERLALSNVKVKRSFLFDQLSCPPLPVLSKVEVSGRGDPKVGVYPFLREILKACRLQHLSIEADGAISVRQHTKLADLLWNQTRMHSLRLATDDEIPKEFECYMPFLCAETPAPLVELNLSGCCIQVHTFNKLIAALSSKQPALKSLFLGQHSVAGDRKNYREMVNMIDLLPLAKMKGLQHLDLSGFNLPDGKTVALLKALTEAAAPLVSLDVSGNLIASPTISAIADLLWESKTLRQISCGRSKFRTDVDGSVAMAKLVQAVEHNRSLRLFAFSWNPDLAEYRASVEACLDRNTYAPQRAFMEAAVQNAAAFVIPLFAGDLLYPQDMIHLIIKQGLTEHDALTLSSIDKKARKSHDEFLRKTGS